MLLALLLLIFIIDTCHTFTLITIVANITFIHIFMSTTRVLLHSLYLFFFCWWWLLLLLLLLLLLSLLFFLLSHSAAFFCRHLYINSILSSFTVISTLQHLCMVAKSLSFHLYRCIGIALGQVWLTNAHIRCTKPTHRTQSFYYSTTNTGTFAIFSCFRWL